MAILTICEFPDPILKQATAPVAEMNAEIEKLIADMIETMYHAPGVGLAANQVGASKRIVVLDVSTPEEPLNTVVIVNPQIITLSEESEKAEEKCLSVPDFMAEVERALSIKVVGKSPAGEDLEIEADHFMARVLQHEIDHLDGLLYLDRIGKLKRQLYVRQRRKALAKSKKK